MPEKLNIKYNPFFIIPFFAWVVAGGILLLMFTRAELFLTVNRNYSDIADVIMYYTTWLGQGEVIVPALLAIMLIPKFRNFEYFMLALVCNFIPFLIQQILKSVFEHPRPQLLYHYQYWMHVEPNWPKLLERSFPSGHSEGAFSFFCFLSLLLPVRYRAFGLLFFAVALTVCYSRMYLAAHFFDDVYSGSILGAVLTTIFFSAFNEHKYLFFKKNGTFINHL